MALPCPGSARGIPVAIHVFNGYATHEHKPYQSSLRRSVGKIICAYSPRGVPGIRAGRQRGVGVGRESKRGDRRLQYLLWASWRSDQ